MEGQIVEDPALKQRYRFSHSVDPDGGAVLHVETWVDPGGGVTPHVHPAMEERFHVLEGNPSLLAGRAWARYGPGDEIVVPAGLRHAYRNETGAPAHLRADVRPPSSLQAFLEEVAELSQAGLISRNGLPRRPARARARGGDRPAPPRHGHAAVPADAAAAGPAAAVPAARAARRATESLRR